MSDWLGTVWSNGDDGNWIRLENGRRMLAEINLLAQQLSEAKLLLRAACLEWEHPRVLESADKEVRCVCMRRKWYEAARAAGGEK